MNEISVMANYSMKETQLENMLRYKSPDIRRDVISLLMGLDDERLYAACERLLSDKSGEKRTAGLDIVMQLKKDKNRSGLFVRAKAAVSEMKTDVSKEQILIDEIMGGADNRKTGIAETQGITPLLAIRHCVAHISKILMAVATNKLVIALSVQPESVFSLKLERTDSHAGHTSIQTLFALGDT